MHGIRACAYGEGWAGLVSWLQNEERERDRDRDRDRERERERERESLLREVSDAKVILRKKFTF